MTGISCILLVSLVVGAADRPVVSALKIDGKRMEGIWGGLGSDGRIMLESSGGPQAVAPADLVSLRWPPRTPSEVAAEYGITVHFADGGRTRARITDGGASHLSLTTPLLGERKVPMGSLAAILFASQPHDEAQRAFTEAIRKRDPSEDALLVVRDGRLAVLRGATESLGPDGGAFRWRDRTVPFKADQTYALVFAAGVGPSVKAQAVCELRDGSAWAGRLVEADRSSLKIELTDGIRLDVPFDGIQVIRFRSDKVAYLSDLDPVSYESESFLGADWPYRRDRSVANRPMRIGAETFERGIGVHSKAKLVYELNQEYAQFAAVIGIDEAVGDLGNAVFRVVADGKEAFTSASISGRDEAVPVLVDVGGVRKLELVVDFGEDLDIGDQANWANARLIK